MRDHSIYNLKKLPQLDPAPISKRGVNPNPKYIVILPLPETGILARASWLQAPLRRSWAPLPSKVGNKHHPSQEG